VGLRRTNAGEVLGEVKVTPMPTHEFLLLPEKDDGYSGYMGHFNGPNALKLDDDIVLYMMDTLRWIPSINPANPNQWSGSGLNYYGPTVINKTGAGKAARLLRLWAALLQEGPDALELTGLFEQVEGDLSTSGKYAVIAAPRDELVKTLTDIADFAEKATSGRYYLLHLGI
jgi:hypothetical protein